jgi:hypothetical protein
MHTHTTVHTRISPAAAARVGALSKAVAEQPHVLVLVRKAALAASILYLILERRHDRLLVIGRAGVQVTERDNEILLRRVLYVRNTFARGTGTASSYCGYKIFSSLLLLMAPNQNVLQRQQNEAINHTVKRSRGPQGNHSPYITYGEITGKFVRRTKNLARSAVCSSYLQGRKTLVLIKTHSICFVCKRNKQTTCNKEQTGYRAEQQPTKRAKESRFRARPPSTLFLLTSVSA